MELSLILSSLIINLPSLIIWLVALILASVLLKKSGGKTERFLLIGCIIMLVSSILAVPQPVITHYFLQSGRKAADLALITSIFNSVISLISLVGIIYLFLAVWKKFTEKRKQ